MSVHPHRPLSAGVYQEILIQFLVIVEARRFLQSMAESQLKSTRLAPGCGHPIYDWDTHNLCFPCCEKGKGQDVCVTSKEEDCFNCLQFTSEQKRKLKAKTKTKAKEISITKEVEDSLLGNESDHVQCSPEAEKSQPAVEDPLANILRRLDDMQSQISYLETASSSSSFPWNNYSSRWTIICQKNARSSWLTCTCRLPVRIHWIKL